MRRLRIAILTHSTNPRGAVVHALELGDALAGLGHAAVVFAPDVQGGGFFRPSVCETIAMPAAPAVDVAALVALRRVEIGRYFSKKSNRDFDVLHAQDSISGNALADLKEAGRIACFARTVHHVDAFDDSRLMALQARGIAMADRHFVVSRQGQARLGREFGVTAEMIGNGVDTQRFTAQADARDAELQARLRLGNGPILLAVGGIEERKNSVRILHAFADFRTRHPSAQLVIAGGASLLDHSAYAQRFQTALSALALPEPAVVVTGVMPQALMPALYRRADLLVFASVNEGFGLAVLEAMASGLPVLTSAIAPFTEYLETADAAWCNPYDIASITAAMARAFDPPLRAALVQNGLAVAARHDWQRIAAAHIPTYAAMREPVHA